MYFWDVQRECLRAGRGATLTDADVQGMRVGVLSPFFYNQTPERGGAAGSLLVENSYFRVYYSYDAPETSAPCQIAVRDIDGWVCRQ